MTLFAHTFSSINMNWPLIHTRLRIGLDLSRIDNQKEDLFEI